MADYFPLIARAVGSLPEKTGEARKAVYERARRALLAQLRAVDPPLAESEVQRERQALEDAIIRVEADFAAPLSAPVVPPPAPPAPPPPPPAPPAAPAAEPAARPGDFSPSESEAVAAGLDPAQIAASAHDWRSEAARMVRARESAPALDEGGAEVADSEIDETVPDQAPPPARSGRGRLIGILFFLLLLIAAAAVGYTQRATIVALIGGGASSPDQPAAPAPAGPVRADAPKSTDRIAQAPDTSRPAAPAPSGSANAPSGGINVAQRAALFEESPGGGEQGLQQYVGTVVWSTETTPAGNGQAPDVGIRADISIPARDIGATLTIRRNQDASVPASHIIEVQFKLPPNFDLGNVSSVPGMRAKASEAAQGAPLVGLAVRVAPSYFLIGLSSLDADVQRNLGFLITRNWLDLPVVFENGRRAILVLEKGEAGDQVFRQAYTAWGLQPPPPQQ
ncbi:hypothetical protein MWN33_09030 [Starkeya koreensis]|uniref:Histidine kinase n=1 Tax=Ancylobacter koreensis TaxID=266121 RepID=A0ABT0DM24_9HYPH|nr:hypothetical protein [Ancylobacter koreensis]MCK0208172.1 hypothetical protein [Ancylobacter koreensis]